ncbi:hypothetical protein QQ020_08080 [Fulvivirgaceae bacterium BMA12]|uniref:Type IX secretion system membrane protein PorP/SprF n=1 Tax=Agaribacillus aureus TaxID=3051825 RepID=A0ABT8L2L8_9BACT|nr:hypothetical protein [Fulvivirgaceae bacterium BMA12]
MTVLCSKSQPFNHNISAKSSGMGDATVAFNDHWSVFNNVGGISRTGSIVALFSVYNRFNMQELSTVNAGLVYPMKGFTWGLTINRFGAQIHQQNQVGIAIGNTIQNTSLGVKINYLMSSTEGYGSQGYLITEVGSITELSPSIRIGLYVYNLNLAKFAESGGRRLPISFKSGLSYQPSATFVLNIEIEKTLNHQPDTKIGLLYHVKKHIYLTTGIQTNPLNYNFGTGVNQKRLEIGYALSGHTQLGLSHLLSISYKLKPEK